MNYKKSDKSLVIRFHFMAGDSELCRVPYDLLNSFCITQVKAGDDSAYNEFASFVVKP